MKKNPEPEPVLPQKPTPKKDPSVNKPTDAPQEPTQAAKNDNKNDKIKLDNKPDGKGKKKKDGCC